GGGGGRGGEDGRRGPLGRRVLGPPAGGDGAPEDESPEQRGHHPDLRPRRLRPASSLDAIKPYYCLARLPPWHQDSIKILQYPALSTPLPNRRAWGGVSRRGVGRGWQTGLRPEAERERGRLRGARSGTSTAWFRSAPRRRLRRSQPAEAQFHLPATP